MKVAFGVFGDSTWTGGINYLVNLLSAFGESEERLVRPVLFAGEDANSDHIRALEPYLSQPPIISPLWSSQGVRRQARRLSAAVLQRDVLLSSVYRKHGIQLAFQHGEWLGCWFPVPTLAWIADFQHRHLPHMFSRFTYIKRELGYRALSVCARRILVSSQDARNDCESFYPRSRGRTRVLPFAVRLGETQLATSPDAIREQYRLPARFIYLPNQFWKHKNHIGVVRAVQQCRSQGTPVVLVSSGGLSDVRNPAYPDEVVGLVKQFGLEEHFRILGLIPYEHVTALMRASIAVINPSFSEGWSTTVEEAKGLGVPLLLSSLRVHREQAASHGIFFDPNRVDDIARAIAQAWSSWPAGPRPDAERQAKERLRAERIAFARGFARIAEEAIASFDGRLTPASS